MLNEDIYTDTVGEEEKSAISEVVGRKKIDITRFPTPSRCSFPVRSHFPLSFPNFKCYSQGYFALFATMENESSLPASRGGPPEE